MTCLKLLVTFEKGKQYQYGEARLAVIARQPEYGALNPVRVITADMSRLARRRAILIASCSLL